MNPAPAKPNFAPAWLRPAIVVLAALLLLACFSTEVADSDTFFHLEAGKYVLDHHRLPLPDPFSFTTYLGKALPGEDVVRSFNITHSWLGEVIIYLSYAAGGYGGMVLLRALIMTAYCGFAGLWIYRRTGVLYRAIAAAFVTGFIASYFSSDRPYQMTYLLIVATIVIVESGRRLWLLPPLFLLWANLHGGYIMGFVVLGAYCAEALRRQLRSAPREGDRHLWLAAVASVAAAFCNPNGFRTFAILLLYRHSNLTNSVYEWQKPAVWPPSFLNLLLFGALAVLLWQRHRTRLADWVLLILFGAAYFSAVRNSNLAGLVAPALIACYLPWNRLMGARAEWALAAVLALAMAVPFARGRAFQLRCAEWKYPGGAADFLLSHGVTQPMFHTFDKGGYLMWRCWPLQRSFIDGRSLNETVFADYQRMVKYLPGTRELLNRYGIQVIVMNAFEANAGSTYVLPLALADPAEKEWKMVFADAGAAVFMRQAPQGVSPLQPSRIFDSMEAQCQAILDHDPSRPRCARSLANLFRNMRDTARARRWMEFYLEHRPDQNPSDDAFYRELSGAGQ